MQEKTLLLNEKVSDFSQEMDTITDGYSPNLDKPFQISKEEELIAFWTASCFSNFKLSSSSLKAVQDFLSC